MYPLPGEQAISDITQINTYQGNHLRAGRQNLPYAINWVRRLLTAENIPLFRFRETLSSYPAVSAEVTVG